MFELTSKVDYQISDYEGSVARLRCGTNKITLDQYERLSKVDVFIGGLKSGMFVLDEDTLKELREIQEVAKTRAVQDKVVQVEDVVEDLHNYLGSPDFDKKFNTKLALDEYAETFGVKLNRSKTMKNMLEDFKVEWEKVS